MEIKKSVLLFCALFAGCLCRTAAQEQGKEVLLVIEGDTVTKETFLKSYGQNQWQGDEEIWNREDLEEYLQMYINFRLKVRAAKDARLDTVLMLQRELEKYRLQLARPYLMDTALQAKLVEEACHNLHYVVNCRQILIPVPRYANPKDTLAAYQLCMDLRNRILNGADFANLALQYSADYARQRASGQSFPITGYEGETGYFTAFNKDYSLEKVAYSLPIGELSMPVRTRQGYHLIEVLDRVPSLGRLSGGHILIVPNPQDSIEDTPEGLEARIWQVYDSLQAGMTFADAAKKYSMDLNTASSGGNFGIPFAASQMYPEMVREFLRLKVNEYSKPFKSRFGWHIVRLTGAEGVGSCSEEYNRIMSFIDRDAARASVPFRAFQKEQLSLHKHSWNKKVLAEVRAYFSDTVSYRDIPKDSVENPELLSKTVYFYEGEPHSVMEFMKIARTMVFRQEVITAVDVWFDAVKAEFEGAVAMRYEIARLEDKYPEFKAVMDEYRDGVYLFDISNKEVWGRAVSDTIGLESYFAEHKDSYMQPEKARVRMFAFDGGKIKAKSVEKVIGKACKGLDDAAKDSDTVNSQLQAMLDKKFGKDKVVFGSFWFAQGENELLEQLPWSVGNGVVESQDGKTVLVFITEIQPSMPYSLDEIRGQVISDYQEYLEEEWVKALRQQYDVSVFQDVFESIFSK